MVNLVTNGHLATCNMLHLTRAPRTQFTYVPLSTGWEAGWGGGIGRASALLSPGGLGKCESPPDYYVLVARVSKDLGLIRLELAIIEY